MKKIYLSKEKTGYYYIYYFAPNGKRTSISTKTKIKSEALEVLSNFEKLLADRKKNNSTNIKLSQFRLQFLKYSEAYHSWKHTLDYKTTFNSMLNYFGDIDISEFNHNNVEEYIQKIIRTVSIHAARKYLINIKAMFNRAVVMGLLKQNPTVNIKRIKAPEKLPLFFTKDDFVKLLDSIDNIDWRDIIEFAVNTGLRQMEILSLTKRQFNSNQRIIVLDNQQHITKSKKIRVIPLNSKALEILDRRSTNQLTDNIFTLNGSLINQDHLVHKFKDFVISAKLNPKLRFHSLRHTFASWLVQRGVSIYEVSKLLGHADVSTTQIYAHLRNDDLRNAVETLNFG